MAGLDKTVDIKQEPLSPVNTIDQLDTTTPAATTVGSSITADNYMQLHARIKEEGVSEPLPIGFSSTSRYNDLPSRSTNAATNYSQLHMEHGHQIKTEYSAESPSLAVTSSGPYSAESPSLALTSSGPYCANSSSLAVTSGPNCISGLHKTIAATNNPQVSLMQGHQIKAENSAGVSLPLSSPSSLNVSQLSTIGTNYLEIPTIDVNQIKKEILTDSGNSGLLTSLPTSVNVSPSQSTAAENEKTSSNTNSHGIILPRNIPKGDQVKTNIKVMSNNVVIGELHLRKLSTGSLQSQTSSHTYQGVVKPGVQTPASPTVLNKLQNKLNIGHQGVLPVVHPVSSATRSNQMQTTVSNLMQTTVSNLMQTSANIGHQGVIPVVYSVSPSAVSNQTPTKANIDSQRLVSIVRPVSSIVGSKQMSTQSNIDHQGVVPITQRVSSAAVSNQKPNRIGYQGEALQVVRPTLQMVRPVNGIYPVALYRATAPVTATSVQSKTTTTSIPNNQIGCKTIDPKDVTKSQKEPIILRTDKHSVSAANKLLVRTVPKNSYKPDIALKPDIKNCLTLVEMMDIMDSGQNLMTFVETIGDEYKRCQLFCNAAKKYCVNGIRPGISLEFYAALQCAYITFSEVRVLKKHVENTLYARLKEGKLKISNINFSPGGSAFVKKKLAEKIFHKTNDFNSELEEDVIGKSVSMSGVQVMNTNICTSSNSTVEAQHYGSLVHSTSPKVLANPSSSWIQIQSRGLSSNLLLSETTSQKNLRLNTVDEHVSGRDDKDISVMPPVEMKVIPTVQDVTSAQEQSDITTCLSSASNTEPQKKTASIAPVKVNFETDELTELGLHEVGIDQISTYGDQSETESDSAPHEAEMDEQTTTLSEIDGDVAAVSENHLSPHKQLNADCENDNSLKWNSGLMRVRRFSRGIDMLCTKQKHPKYRILYCYLCMHASSSAKHLHEHMLKVHLDPAERGEAMDRLNAMCTHCFLIERSYHAVKLHEVVHHLSDFPCYFCGISTKCLNDMIDHICTHHAEVSCCPYCSVKFRRIISVKTHIISCHIDKPIPNKNERMCYSCRHVFMDEQALQVHKSANKKKVFLIDKSILSSLTRQYVRLGSERHEISADDSKSFCSKWTWWKNYLDKVSGLIRSVRVYGNKVCYPYGDLLHTCEVSDTLENELHKLPSAMDWLVQMTVEVFGQLHSCSKLSLTKDVQKMLSTVYVSGMFATVLKAIGIEYKFCLFRVNRNPCTTEILIEGKMFTYSYEEAWRYCAVDCVRPEDRMPVILEGLLRLVFTEFPQLDPSKCFRSNDFWSLVVTASRTPLFRCLLASVSVKPFPWNMHVRRTIQGFLQKCCNFCELDFGDIDAATAILKCALSSIASSSAVPSSTVSVNLATCSGIVSSEDQQPEVSKSMSVSSPVDTIIGDDATVVKNRVYEKRLYDVVRSGPDFCENPEFKKMFIQALKEPLLTRQIFDLKWWVSFYKLKGINPNKDVYTEERLQLLLNERERNKRKVTSTCDNPVLLSDKHCGSENSERENSMEMQVENRRVTRECPITKDIDHKSLDRTKHTIDDEKGKAVGTEAKNCKDLSFQTDKQCLYSVTKGSTPSGKKCENDIAKRQPISLNTETKRMHPTSLNDEVVADNACSGSNARSLTGETVDTNRKAVNCMIPDVSSMCPVESVVTGDTENTGMKKMNVEKEILPKWKKSFILLDIFNENIERQSIKNEVRIIDHYYCYLCSFRTYCLKDVYKHVAETHLNPERAIGAQQDFVCTHCFEIQTDLTSLRAHEIDNHLSDFPCYFCGISNNSLDAMLHHICKDHSTLYSCGECDKSGFLSQKELKEHSDKEHSYCPNPSRTFMCLYCSLRFVSASVLKTHLLKLHTNVPIPNTNERICYSCRHRFIDDQALKFHQNNIRNVDTPHPITPSSSASLSKQVLSLNATLKSWKNPNGMEQLFNFNRTWWIKYLQQVKDDVRSVTINGDSFFYRYGDVLDSCKVSSYLEPDLVKLPMVIDKLIEIVLERFSIVCQNRNLALTKRERQMLSIVCASDVFGIFLKSLDMEMKIRFFCSNRSVTDLSSKTAKISVKGKMYEYPYATILGVCSVGAVNSEIMPGIIDGLLQLIFSEFAWLNPCECFQSADFFGMVATVSRTRLFQSLLISSELSCLPWNVQVRNHIHSFLLRCHTGNIDLWDFDTCPSVLKSNLSSDMDWTSLVSSILTKAGNTKSKLSSEFDALSQNSYSSPLFQTTRLEEQLFDLKYWASKGMVGTNVAVKQLTHTHSREKDCSERKDDHQKDGIDRCDATMSQSDKCNEFPTNTETAGEKIEDGTLNLKRKWESINAQNVKRINDDDTVSSGSKMDSGNNGTPLTDLHASSGTSIDLTSHLASTKSSVECTKEQMHTKKSVFTNRAAEKIIHASDDSDVMDEEALHLNKIFHSSKWSFSNVLLEKLNREIEKVCYKLSFGIVYCYLCSFSGCDIKTVYKHIVDTHVDKDKPGKDSTNFMCTHCSKIEGTYAELQRHEIGNHLSDCSCYFCGIPCDSINAVLDHICTTHSEVYHCTCGEKLIGKCHFLQHWSKRNHHVPMSLSSWLCVYCSVQFNSPSLLLAHFRTNHLHKPIPNPAECVCYSCRHVFMDDQALRVHRKGHCKDKANLYSLNPSTLLSISRNNLALKAPIDNTEMQRKDVSDNVYGFKWSWWKEHVFRIKDVVRTVVVNGWCFSYPYGKLMSTCKVAMLPRHKLDKLPEAFDKLLEITLTRFRQLQKNSILSLDIYSAEMLSTVFKSGGYLHFLKSIGMENTFQLFCRSPRNRLDKVTTEMRIRGIGYKYQADGMLRYCAMENMNRDTMCGILSGLIQLACTQVTKLHPVACIPSRDFWEMIVTISRTPLFTCLLESASLKPLPWSKPVQRHIHSFLSKSMSGKIKFGDMYAGIPIAVNISIPSSGSGEFYDKSHMLAIAANQPLLLQQLFDLSYWSSTCGINDNVLRQQLSNLKCFSKYGRKPSDVNMELDMECVEDDNVMEPSHLNSCISDEDEDTDTAGEELGDSSEGTEKNRVRVTKKRKLCCNLIRNVYDDKILQPFCVKAPKRFKCSAVVLERNTIAEMKAMEIIQSNSVKNLEAM